jgi:hypothetical protein
VNGVGRVFQASGLARRHWSNASPIRAISRNAFSKLDLPSFDPHSFRHTLAQFGQRVCRTPEQFQAWAQNMGHPSALPKCRVLFATRSTRK